jgi:hypothetical protein
MDSDRPIAIHVHEVANDLNDSPLDIAKLADPVAQMHQESEPCKRKPQSSKYCITPSPLRR